MPLPASNSTYSPAGVEAMVRMGPEMVRALPKMEGLRMRGWAVSPTTFHSVPSDMMICGPRMLAATTLGVMREKLALKGRGGNLMRPTVRMRSRSTMLMLSPPVLAT